LPFLDFLDEKVRAELQGFLQAPSDQRAHQQRDMEQGLAQGLRALEKKEEVYLAWEVDFQIQLEKFLRLRGYQLREEAFRQWRKARYDLLSEFAVERATLTEASGNFEEELLSKARDVFVDFRSQEQALASQQNLERCALAGVLIRLRCILGFLRLDHEHLIFVRKQRQEQEAAVVAQFREDDANLLALVQGGVDLVNLSWEGTPWGAKMLVPLEVPILVPTEMVGPVQSQASTPIGEVPFKIDTMEFDWDTRRAQLLAEGQGRIALTEEEQEPERDYYRSQFSIDLWEAGEDLLGNLNIGKLAAMYKGFMEKYHNPHKDLQASAKLEKELSAFFSNLTPEDRNRGLGF
jgi:hypothetical protein